MRKMEKIDNALKVLFVFTIAISKTINLIILILLWLIKLAQKIKNLKLSIIVKNTLKDPVLISFFLYLGISILGIFYSENIVEGVRRTKILLNFPLIYLIFRSYDIEKHKNQYLWAFLIGILFLNICGFIHDFWCFGKLFFPFSPLKINSIWVGNLNALAIYTGILLCIQEKNSFRKFLSISFTGIIFLGLIFTSSRTAYLAFISTILIAGLIFLIKEKKFKYLLLGFLSICVLILGIFQVPYVKNKVEIILPNVKKYELGEKDTSIGQRLEMWRASYYIIKKHLLFGAGTGDYQVEVKKLIKKGIISPCIKKYNHPHNVYFFILDTLGLVGLLAFLIFIFIILRKSLKCFFYFNDFYSFYVFITTFHLLIGSLTEVLFYIHIVFIAFSFIIGLGLCRQGKEI